MVSGRQCILPIIWLFPSMGWTFRLQSWTYRPAIPSQVAKEITEEAETSQGTTVALSSGAC